MLPSPCVASSLLIVTCTDTAPAVRALWALGPASRPASRSDPCEAHAVRHIDRHAISRRAHPHVSRPLRGTLLYLLVSTSTMLLASLAHTHERYSRTYNCEGVMLMADVRGCWSAARRVPARRRSSRPSRRHAWTSRPVLESMHEPHSDGPHPSRTRSATRVEEQGDLCTQTTIFPSSRSNVSLPLESRLALLAVTLRTFDTYITARCPASAVALQKSVPRG